MESNKPLRTHPKMTKVLLGQIDSLDKAGRSVEDIAADIRDNRLDRICHHSVWRTNQLRLCGCL